MTFKRMGMFLVNRNRRLAQRIGRRVYKMARNDVHNNMETNGETLLQRAVLRTARNREIRKVVAFDVGANLGLWTKSFLRSAESTDQHKQVTVHAFEPFPETNASINEALKEKIEDQVVRCNRVALSNACGEVTMYGKPDAGSSAINRGDDESDLVAVKVRRSTVVDYCNENTIKEIHLLKIDAEGHDFPVISGARELLHEGRIWFLQFEYTHFWVFSRHYLKDVFDLIQETQYSIGKLTPDGLEVYESWHPEHERFFDGNYVLVRSDLIDQIPTRRMTADASNTLA